MVSPIFVKDEKNSLNRGYQIEKVRKKLVIYYQNEGFTKFILPNQPFLKLRKEPKIG
jgi:hypothetical protein